MGASTPNQPLGAYLGAGGGVLALLLAAVIWFVMRRVRSSGEEVPSATEGETIGIATSSSWEEQPIFIDNLNPLMNDPATTFATQAE
jgi:hypothetical protein